MADDPSPPPTTDDLDRWYGPPATDFADPWSDPVDLRARHRRQLRRYQVGFAILGFSLVVACLSYLAPFFLIFFPFFPLRMALRSWDFETSTAVVLASFVGAGLIWGRWPDESWQRRSGLLLLMCMGDLVMWSMDNAVRLGLSDVAIGHEYFRHSLGQVLGWSQFALITSLSADLATRLGESSALDFGRAVRSLISLGALVWFLFFYSLTNWESPIWPLRERRLNFLSFQLGRISILLSTGVVVAVTLLCLYAGRTCRRAVQVIDAEDRANESLLSRSEVSWNEYQENDPDRHGR